MRALNVFLKMVLIGIPVLIVFFLHPFFIASLGRKRTGWLVNKLGEETEALYREYESVD